MLLIFDLVLLLPKRLDQKKYEATTIDRLGFAAIARTRKLFSMNFSDLQQ